MTKKRQKIPLLRKNLSCKYNENAHTWILIFYFCFIYLFIIMPTESGSINLLLFVFGLYELVNIEKWLLLWDFIKEMNKEIIEDKYETGYKNTFERQ